MEENQDVKELIIAEAGRMFLKYGVRSVTMDDISRELSISKKTIYAHFKDKDEIVSLATREHIRKEQTDYDQIFKNSTNAIEELFKVSKCLRNTMGNMNPMVLHEIQKFHRDAWNQYVKFKEEFVFNSIVKNIRDGVEAGYFRPEIDPEILATLRVSQVEASFDSSIYPPERFDFTEVHIQLFEHFLNGLLTDKGRALYREYHENEISHE